MIRYPASRADLEEAVDKHAPNWRTDAATRTNGFLAAGKYEEASSSWGKVKAVYQEIQHFKCIFCERALSKREVGSIEHDLEHFRPKGSLKAWPTGARARELNYTFATGAAGTGYYWLAYDLENYAAACKPCNSILKKDFFPVAGVARGAAGSDIAALNQLERPFLIYPFGDTDTDPETLITFEEGIVAVPAAVQGLDQLRARVTIDFFRLNDREELWDERFRVIEKVWLAARNSMLEANAERRAAAERSLKAAVSSDAPHASCARTFRRILVEDLDAAWRQFQAAEAYLQRRKAERRQARRPARRRRPAATA